MSSRQRSGHHAAAVLMPAGRRGARRVSRVTAALLALGALLPGPALAHGLVVPPDEPIPRWLFALGATLALLLSFAALGALWSRPKLQQDRWLPLPLGLGRALGGPELLILTRTVGAVLLGLVLWSGFAGDQLVSENFAPTFVFVIFWVGLVPASVLLGDVFRAFNPWAAIARGLSWAAARISGRSLPPPLAYPERLGRWPAVLGIAEFAFIELVDREATEPARLALFVLIYTAITLAAMSFYGIEAWLDRGEAFSVLFNLFSQISPWERRDGVLGLRPPLSGLSRLDASPPGTVALLGVMIGAVTFDGLSGGPVWARISGAIVRDLVDRGVGQDAAVLVAGTVGLAAGVGLVLAVYGLGTAGARRVGGGYASGDLAQAFVHSLVPIAVAYVCAHYLTFLLIQGQAIAPLVSDPLGRGWNLLGTGDWTVNIGLLTRQSTWYVQVALVVTGHVAALVCAHDRALALYHDPRRATLSQCWMLGVMVGFTVLALWLLAQAGG